MTRGEGEELRLEGEELRLKDVELLSGERPSEEADQEPSIRAASVHVRSSELDERCMKISRVGASRHPAVTFNLVSSPNSVSVVPCDLCPFTF